VTSIKPESDKALCGVSPRILHPDIAPYAHMHPCLCPIDKVQGGHVEISSQAGQAEIADLGFHVWRMAQQRAIKQDELSIDIWEY